MPIRPAHALRALALALTLSAAGVSMGLAEEAKPNAVPAGAGYLLPNGAVAIMADAATVPLLTKLNAAFAKAQPGIHFEVQAHGPATVLPALTAGVSAFGPMAREAWRNERAAFKQNFGDEPVAIRIGSTGYGPRAEGATPAAIYVHPANPLAGLTVAQLAQIFGSGAKSGDITRWSQLGLGDAWANRTIHAYGPRDDGGFTTAFRQAHLGNLPLTLHYEAFSDPADVLAAVAQDPYGIGFVGPIRDAAAAGRVKLLPLAAKPGEPFHGPGLVDLQAGAYPLATPLAIYVPRVKGQALAPFVRDYLRLVLSSEGQAIVASETGTALGAVPLAPAELESERKKVDAL